MRKLLLHLSFWALFFLMWNRIMYFYLDNVSNKLYFSALDVALVASAFYIIYLCVMPIYIKTRKLWKLLLLALLVTVLLASFYAWAMGQFLHHQLVPIEFNFSWNYTDLQYNRFFIALLGMLGGIFVKLAADRIAMKRKMEIMEKEKSKAELAYLKSQLNPHFLFNSLNSLYTQLELDLNGAKTTLISLADLLRYQLYECNHDFIALDKELAYLHNYFNLQRIRKDNCKAEIRIGQIAANLEIAPMLLIPFVENAFKYVSDDEERINFIEIDISLTQHKLKFSCSNSYINSDREADTGQNKGIGLINVAKRLELIYKDKYWLQQAFNDGIYRINLELNLK